MPPIRLDNTIRYHIIGSRIEFENSCSMVNFIMRLETIINFSYKEEQWLACVKVFGAEKKRESAKFLSYNNACLTVDRIVS